MSLDDSRLASVLGELADLGRRLSDRAAELARLVGEGSDSLPSRLTDRVAGVRTSAADLFAATAAIASASRAAGSKRKAAIPKDMRGATASETTRKAPTKAVSRPAPRRRSPAAGAGGRLPGAAASERRLRPLLPALVSAAVNVGVILGLALFFVAAEAKPKRPVLTLGASDDLVVDELAPVVLDAADEAVDAEHAAELQTEPATLATDEAVIDEVSFDDAAFAGDLAAVEPAAFDSIDALADVGGSSAGSGQRGKASGKPAGGGAPGSGSFFGRPGEGQSVCFICDNSNSYRNGGFHTVLDELARAVDALRPDQSFFVVFFSDTAYPLFHPEPVDALQLASPENKQRLRAWLATVEMCGGGRGIDDAIRIAGSLSADAVYFLSDGEHAASVVDRVVTADFGDAVVHTFGMQQGVLDRWTGRVDADRLRQQQEFDRNLVAIATAHGGTFTPVTVPPQAAVLEKLRPIQRNRAPGPVWGRKL